MTDVATAVAELAHWLPRNHAHIATPDQDGTHTRGKPGTKPPGNWGSLALDIDIATELRRLEDTMRARQGLPIRHRGGSNRNTGLALVAIGNLSHTADPHTNHEARRTISHYALIIRQDPNNDDAPTWRKLRAGCPYCRREMLRFQRRDGVVTCLAVGGCLDTEGKHPVGHVGMDRDGVEAVFWRDGLVT